MCGHHCQIGNGNIYGTATQGTHGLSCDGLLWIAETRLIDPLKALAESEETDAFPRFESLLQVRRVVKSNGYSYLLGVQAFVRQQKLCSFDPLPRHVLKRGFPGCRLERSGEVKTAEACDLREFRQAHGPAEVCIDVVHYVGQC